MVEDRRASRFRALLGGWERARVGVGGSDSKAPRRREVENLKEAEWGGSSGNGRTRVYVRVAV